MYTVYICHTNLFDIVFELNLHEKNTFFYYICKSVKPSTFYMILPKNSYKKKISINFVDFCFILQFTCVATFV